MENFFFFWVGINTLDMKLIENSIRNIVEFYKTYLTCFDNLFLQPPPSGFRNVLFWTKASRMFKVILLPFP